jgi:type I restriction enzyme S subunit
LVLEDRDEAFGAFCKVLRPGPGVDPAYFGHFFQTAGYRRHVERVAAGININNLRNEHLDDIEIPFPPVEEQRRIAAVLDAAGALRAKRRQALAKLDTLTQAIFIDMFGDPVQNPRGWPVQKMGEVLESATYGTSKKAHETGQYPVLRMGNLTTDGQLDLDDLKYVDLESKELGRHLVQAGDVLFNRTNSADLVGKTAAYRLPHPMAYAGYLVRLRPAEELDAEYLGAFMNLPTTKIKLRSMCKSIVGMANINAKEVQTIEMPLPPIELQKGFAEARGATAAKRMGMERHAGALDTLFASLQQRAFRGEL